MKIEKLLCAAVLGMSACGLFAQNLTVQLEAKDEPGGLPAKSGPKRAFTPKPPRELQARAFAFGGHPFGPESSSQPVLVMSSNFDAKAAEQLREDIAVMARILQKIAAEHGTEPEKVLGLDILVHGGRSTRNLYLDDYGVLFTVNTDMVLKGPDTPDPTAKKPEKEVDAEWERARNELFGGRNSPSIKFLERGATRRSFDAQEVDRLRDDLVEALRAAANIRNLKKDQWIVFIVKGSGQLKSILSPEGDELLLEGPENAGESTMVLKARKEDIDAYAKQTLSKTEFRKRVSINIY